MKLFAFVFVTLILVGTPFFSVTAFPQAPDSEVFLFSIDKKDGKYSLTGGKNITNNRGYDNQPSFTLDSGSILYTSSQNGKDTDIYEYSLETGKVVQITSATDGEYTPKELDSNTVTFVREGKGQEMTVWKYDRETKNESRALKNKEPVAYYAWNYKGDALVWIRYASMVHWINIEKGINRFVSDYAQPSVPHQIPGTDDFSFMHRQPNDELWIKGFDASTRAIRPIIQSKDGKKDYCWMMDGSLLIGSGSKLFRFDPKVDKDWVLLADLNAFGIKDITRLATSFDGKYLALVSNQ